MRRALRIALVTVPLAVLLGTLSGRYAGAGQTGPWLDGLAKPGFYPPGWAFGVAWTILYALMGVAAALVIAARGTPGRTSALVLFVVQLALNLAWAPLFFRFHAIGGATALIPAILVVAALAAWRFAAVRRIAGVLMVPYLLWLAFAGVLAGRLWMLNPNGSRFVPNAAVEVPLAQE